MKDSAQKLIENTHQLNSANQENESSNTNTNPSSSFRKRSFNRGQFSSRKRESSTDVKDTHPDHMLDSVVTKHCNPDIAALNSMVENTYDEEQEFIAEPIAGIEIEDDIHIFKGVDGNEGGEGDREECAGVNDLNHRRSLSELTKQESIEVN